MHQTSETVTHTLKMKCLKKTQRTQI